MDAVDNALGIEDEDAVVPASEQICGSADNRQRQKAEEKTKNENQRHEVSPCEDLSATANLSRLKEFRG